MSINGSLLRIRLTKATLNMASNYQLMNIFPHSWTEEDKLSFPTISKPISHGGFSLSPNGQFERNSHRMHYIVVPPIQHFPLSLRDNDTTRNQHKMPELLLDNMLQFIESSRFSFLKAMNMRVVVDAHVVCTSEVLELIMCAPYEHKSGWSLGVTRYRNTMYICRMDSVQPNAFDQDHLKQVMEESWLMTLRKHCLKESGTGALNNKRSLGGRFHGVFSFDLNGNRILFDSPVLAEPNPNEGGSNPNWAELQMRLVHMSRQDWAIHNRTEALKWWVKCFLLGIESLYIAHRDEHAFVHNIQKTSARDLWKSCDQFWSTHVCANFLLRFLAYISQVMAPIDCPSTVYLFEFDAKQGILAYKPYPGRNQFTFVADWYRMMLDEHAEDICTPVQR
ncbi:protein cutoff [Drosophila ficusphila]|uniref:protein cutoff n=1 Tax=Drosophila ficusphila TaxID=30025 RepID=UPI0007E6B78B|nr:protein cutoff [Drosophila ficusphila]